MIVMSDECPMVRFEDGPTRHDVPPFPHETVAVRHIGEHLMGFLLLRKRKRDVQTFNFFYSVDWCKFISCQLLLVWFII